VCLTALILLVGCARPPAPVSPASLEQRIGQLRSLNDADRARETAAIARDLRRLPAGPEKLTAAQHLTSRATEGDFGRETLQAVTTALAEAIRESPAPPEAAFEALAQLVRFEHMQTTLDDPRLRQAFAALDTLDERRRRADFTLTDLDGKSWTLTALRGRVVLVNFWATWCPPCRKEIPDLIGLQQQFAGQGLIVLGIDDNEEEATVRPFVTAQRMTYPVLLDPGGVVSERFAVTSIPKTFIYDREGALVAQSIDMRTRPQFLSLLAAAGIR
jgi:thiol-disulfide isomerase/thioredoxin